MSTVPWPGSWLPAVLIWSLMLLISNLTSCRCCILISLSWTWPSLPSTVFGLSLVHRNLLKTSWSLLKIWASHKDEDCVLWTIGLFGSKMAFSGGENFWLQPCHNLSILENAQTESVFKIFFVGLVLYKLIKILLKNCLTIFLSFLAFQNHPWSSKYDKINSSDSKFKFKQKAFIYGWFEPFYP